MKWRKSTYSTDYNCVEVALTPESAAIRDSKDPAAGHLTVPGGRWRIFVQGLQNGRFDRGR